MTEPFAPETDLSPLSLKSLLAGDEYIAVVDDSPEIVILLNQYLKKQGINVLTASNTEELQTLLKTEKIALTVLDIVLPGRHGNEIIQELNRSYPDLSVIMVTGTTSLEVALNCLRQGADDYLTKPVNINLFHHTVRNALIKRRLSIANRQYQEQLQATHSRMLFLHQLNLKMNSAYLNAVELNPILQAILVGITSGEGLKFNRAFMALYNEEGTYLEGKLAIGPDSREDAEKVWKSIKKDELQLDEILAAIQQNRISEDKEVNSIVKTLRISSQDADHILIFSSRHKKSIQVTDGRAAAIPVPQELLDILGEDSFIIVPLYSPTRSLGVIIADNFVTRSPISSEDIADLEILASQASLAIEHSHLYQAMTSKLSELEAVTKELERNKNLLVHTERSAAIGKMAGKLVHEIRNPLTSIGGTSRFLERKITDPFVSKFLNIISKETAKIEAALEDLFSAVEEELTLEPCLLFPLIRQSVMALYNLIREKNIEYVLDLEGEGPSILLDEERIRQSFLYLIRDRIEAMAGGGCLKITADERRNDILILIVGSGATVSAAATKQPSFTAKTYENGSGLTQVGQTIRDHGGSFTIQAVESGGTVALITLPTQKKEE